jgi:putative ABC transport system substrate-binding protein
MLNVRRRHFITLLGGAVVGPLAAPLKSFAQQHPGKPLRIGRLVAGSRAEYDVGLEEYRRGMRELGYIEGRTVETEYLYADAQFDRLPGLAARLVEHKVDIIVTASTPAILAAKRATAKSRLCLPPAATQSARAWSQVSLIPAGTSPGYRSWPRT